MDDGGRWGSGSSPAPTSSPARRGSPAPRNGPASRGGRDTGPGVRSGDRAESRADHRGDERTDGRGDARAGVLFAALGPLEVWRASGERIRIDQQKKRVLLLAMLVRPGRWTSVEQLRLALWQDAPPRSALGNIKTYLSELRHTLPPPAGAPVERTAVTVVGPRASVLRRPVGPGRIESRPGEYRLLVDPDEFDVLRFNHAVAAGREAARAGRWRPAADLFEQALGWWRGNAFDELPAEVGGAESLRLDEARWAAREELIDARLALGETDAVLPALRALTVEFPTRERLWAQLLTALERTGRRAEALHEYRELYQRLVTELGIEPGAELRRVHRQVLEAVPSTDAASVASVNRR
ncbi:AfsR/SARP family transcriptional regulator [Frankia sp. R82]|uniref:AfsR/SARP family transcriptional regulator n=1 Tax=Frankia sp. R82 TaxID=2950553 RepID=UPI002043804F|nr:AfsR/SARP family transcriptional regulator [Frankia sp. R82]MCM3883613.1 AfsR/SARP family transcriptional regulator [Frankia sp. R82]